MENPVENYIVSARKYRPSTFRDVVGQHALTVTLKNAIASDRLAHAYLFCGSRGVGKTSCARIFAKTINCTHRTPEGEACNECESCREFNKGTSLNVIELDAASHNGIEDMKSLIEQVMVPPTQGRYRVFIIDEVHMLSAAAFNAFLKTLEEPPSYVIFILATTEKHKIIPTILSRCQIYDFNRISVQDIIDHLTYVAGREGYTADKEGLAVIAERADGAMRDALSIFDQVAASSMGHITYQGAIDSLGVLDKKYYADLTDAFLAGDVHKALLLYNDIRLQGFDSQQFINGLALYLRDLAVAADTSTVGLLEAGDDARAAMVERAAKCPPDFLFKAMSLCNEADLNYRTATNKQFLIELTLIKLCQLQSPSSDNSGSGEGQLKPLKASAAKPAQQAAQAPTSQPAATAATITGAPAPQPKAAPTPPPVATHVPPMTVPRPAATHAKARMMSGPSISIRKVHGAEEAHDTEPTYRRQRRGAYTYEQLTKAWHDFIDKHQEEVVLVNTMLHNTPKATDRPDHYRVTVENSIQVNFFNENSDELHNFLRDALDNDAVTITTEITASTNPMLGWTTKEVFEHEIATKPIFADFVRELKLKL